jgi:hypothetical protein
MEPSLARRMWRAVDEAGVQKRVIGVSRFSSPEAGRPIRDAGAENIAADLIDPEQIARLPPDNGRAVPLPPAR